MMKIDVGQTIGIIANLGVIAGIAFLAIEIQQNNRLLSTEASYIMLQNRIVGRNEIAGNPELASLMRKVNNGERLDALEEFRFRNSAEASIIGMEWEYHQFLDGNIDELPLSGWKRSFSDPNLVRFGWEPVKPILSQEFVDFINQNILED